MNFFITIGLATVLHSSAFLAFATDRKEGSNQERNRYESNQAPLTPEQIKSRIEVKGEIFYLDSTGKKVLRKAPQYKVWRPRIVDGMSQIESRWSSDFTKIGEIAIHHVWTVQDDGSIKVLIEEYGKIDDNQKDTIFSNLLKKEERILEDFAPISWVSARTNANGKFVVRFTPNIIEDQSPVELATLPISGSDILITDNEGSVWSERSSISGKYIAFVTHKGSLFLSFYPFPGSKEIGSASSNKLELKLEGKKAVTITSKTAFLPDDVYAKVYGVFQAGRKTENFSRLKSWSLSDESRFIERMNSKN